MGGVRWGVPLSILVFSLIAAAWFGLARDRSNDGQLRIDEAEWLNMSVFTWQLLVTGEPSDRGANAERLATEDPWLEGIQLSTFGWMNPLLPKVVFGAVVSWSSEEELRGDRRVYPRFTKHLRNDAEVMSRARAQFARCLPAGRGVTLVLASLAAGLLFAIGRRLGGVPAGLATWLLWLLSPQVRSSALWVRTDLFPQLFFLGALAWVLARPGELAGLAGRGALLRSTALLGLLAGLAVGSKPNGALVSFVVALWILGLWWLAPRDRRPSFARGPLPALALAGLLCVSIFWALSPRLWSEPLDGLVETLERWRKSMGIQQQKHAARVIVSNDLLSKVSLAVKGTLGGNEPLRALTGLAGGAVLLLGGAVVLAVRSRSGGGAPARPFEDRARALSALVWVAIAFTGTTLWLPLDRERFFLPYLPAMVLLEGILLAGLIGLVRRWPASSDGGH